MVGEVVAQHLAAERNRATLAKLRDAGVRLSQDEAGPAAGALSGKSFVLTGRLPGLTRGEAEALIEASGGRVGSAVTRATDYVVVGEDPGRSLPRPSNSAPRSSTRRPSASSWSTARRLKTLTTPCGPSLAASAEGFPRRLSAGQSVRNIPES